MFFPLNIFVSSSPNFSISGYIIITRITLYKASITIIFVNANISIDNSNKIIWIKYNTISHIKVAPNVINIIVSLLSFEKFFVNAPP